MYIFSCLFCCVEHKHSIPQKSRETDELTVFRHHWRLYTNGLTFHSTCL